MTNLSHSVVRASVRPETVRARLKVRLEDRLQHQLQGRLHDTVSHRRDPQPATRPRPRLRDHPFLDRQRGERARPQRGPHLTEERHRAALGLDVVGRLAVHARRPGPLVAPHPRPRLPRKAGSATRLNRSPNRRSGSLFAHRCSLAWILSTRSRADPTSSGPPKIRRRYSPTHLLTFHSPRCRLTGPLRPVSGFPGLRLLRGLRPTHGQRSGDGPAQPRPGCVEVRAATDGSRVHCAPIDEGGAHLLSRQHRHDYAADLHRGLRPRRYLPDPESTAHQPDGRALQAGPHPPDSEPVHRLRDVLDGSLRTPSRLASRTRTIWQYWHVPSLSGLLPPSPASPGSGCPQLHPAAATAKQCRSLTSTR